MGTTKQQYTPGQRVIIRDVDKSLLYNETYYDMNGRIIFTISKGLKGIEFLRKAKKDNHLCKIIINDTVEEKPIGWEDIKDMKT